MKRDDKDYAIEFGEYLAASADLMLEAINEHYRLIEEMSEDDVYEDPMAEAFTTLRADIYEFRKRAARAGHAPSAEKFNR